MWKHHHPHRHRLSSMHASAIRVPITGIIEKMNKIEKQNADVNIIESQSNHALTIKATERQNAAPLAFVAAYSS